MAVSFETLRQIVLALPGTSEATSYGTPAFKIGKQLLARMWEDGTTMVLKVEPDTRDFLLEVEPAIFFVTDHYRGYPAVLVRLPKIGKAHLAELTLQSWLRLAPKRTVKAWQEAGTGG